jgi:hypothetical protein
LANSNIINQIRDLPMAFKREYVSIIGEAENINYSSSNQILYIESQEFYLDNEYFSRVEKNNKYQINYLPHSRHVIDVIDEDGVSMLKSR